jgi:hypothetical protein
MLHTGRHIRRGGAGYRLRRRLLRGCHTRRLLATTTYQRVKSLHLTTYSQRIIQVVAMNSRGEWKRTCSILLARNARLCWLRDPLATKNRRVAPYDIDTRWSLLAILSILMLLSILLSIVIILILLYFNTLHELTYLI